MKNYIFKPLALLTIVCAGFVSCGGDDDEGGSSSNGSDATGVVTTTSGEKKLVKQVGGTVLTYDDENKLTRVSDQYGDTYEVTYNPMKITQENSGSGWTESHAISDIGLNGNGAITKLKETYLYSSGDESEEETTTISMSYDGSGRILSLSGGTTYKYTYDGETGKATASGSYKFTWSGNKLTKVTCSTTETSGYKYTSTVEFDYGDGEYDNPASQFTNSMLAGSFDDYYAWFAYVGFFGKGGKYLPTSATLEEVEEEDGDTYEDYDRYTYKYSYNDDGTLASESYKYDTSSSWYTMNYVYADGEISTASKAKVVSSRKPKTRFSNMFLHRNK